MDKNSLAILLLTNQLVRVESKPLNSRDVRAVRKQIPDIGVVTEASAHDLVAEFGLDVALAERIVTLCAAVTAFVFELEKLEESGIRVISELDPLYPSRLLAKLGAKSPAYLLVAGDAELLASRARGIVGSRDVGSEALSVASAAAHAVAANGEIVVSGLAKGVDQASMFAALEAGGRTIGIPSEGLKRVAKKASIRRYVHDGAMCLISPYGPDAPFSVGRAMGRNRLIYAIAISTLVVASDDEKGGTWAGATEAMKENFGRVDVWMGEGTTPGNTRLHSLGARAVRTSADFWRTESTTGVRLDDEGPVQPRLF